MSGSHAGSFCRQISALLSQEEVNQQVIDSSVWLIAHGQIQPGLFIHDGFVVRKGIKAGLAMVTAHAALAKAPEGHPGCCQMNDGVIYTPSAKTHAAHDLFLHSLIGCKQIQRQRVRHGI